MDETWKDALSSAWNGLLYGGGAMRLLRIVLALVLLLSIGWSVYLYKEIITVSRISPVDIVPSKGSPGQEKAYPDLMNGFEEITQARLANTDSAQFASALGRYAFGKPVIPAKPKPAEPVAQGKTKTSAPVPVEEDLPMPPFMEVRAIMILNDRSMALMNIEGEGDGLIVSPGYRFGKGMGKVLSIEPAKVVVLWRGTRIDLGLSTL